jgi:membrane-bound metal-dependent hydrolase YbcI (DUF457 family)
MPSPVGHALGGLLVGLALAPADTARAGDAKSTNRRELFALCVAAACIPDLDFAWGRHNMETHSIGFALLLAILVLAWRRSARLSIACAFAVGTHILFDWLGSDDFAPLGVMALWPVSCEFYFADAYVFATISRRYWLPGFVQHNVMAVLREILILLPPVGLLWWMRRARRSVLNSPG